MTLVFFFLLAVGLAGIVFLARFAQMVPLDLIGRALHPFNILGFLFFITLIDFANLFLVVSVGQEAEFAASTISSSADVNAALAFYVLCQTAVIFGLCIAGVSIDRRAASRMMLRKRRPIISAPVEISAVRVVMIVSLIATIIAGQSLLMTALSQGSLNYIAGVRTRYFADNPTLLVIVATMIPAFILFGSKERYRYAIIILPILLLVLALIGGRSKLIYPIVALLYWLCRTKNIKLMWVYLTAPLTIIAIVVYGYYTRYSYSYISFQDYLNSSGGMFAVLFDEPSISMAEAITLNVNDPILTRAPWESFLGMIMLPIPRSAFPWKPYGVSTDFSMAVDYTKFMLVKSEWTVTGFIDLFYGFGYFGAVFVSGLFGFLWSKILIKGALRRNGTAFCGPILIIISYQFIRGDLNIVSQFLWPTAIILVIFYGLRVVMSLRTKSSINRRAKAP